MSLNLLIIKAFRQLIKPLEQRVLGIVGHGRVKRVNDDAAVQEVQAEFLDGETRDGMPRMQPYGLTSVPDDDAEVVAIFRAGDRGDGYVISIDDGRYRIKLSKGEVALYDKVGSTIILKANGNIELTPASGKVVVVGDLEASGEVKAGAIPLSSHVHISAGSGSPTGGPQAP